MAVEPIDPVVRKPLGGWPKVCFRVELTPYCTADEAVYAVAGLSRALRHGVVADLEGHALYAWPHQSVAEIERTHLAMRRMTTAMAQSRVASGGAS